MQHRIAIGISDDIQRLSQRQQARRCFLGAEWHQMRCGRPEGMYRETSSGHGVLDCNSRSSFLIAASRKRHMPSHVGLLSTHCLASFNDRYRSIWRRRSQNAYLRPVFRLGLNCGIGGMSIKQKVIWKQFRPCCITVGRSREGNTTRC